MKRLIPVFLAVAFLTAPSQVHAQRAWIGFFHFDLKTDFIKFTDDILKDNEVDTGPYFGFETYIEAMRNLYIGVESGYAFSTGTIKNVDTNIVYVPVELNVKYAFVEAPRFVVDVGAGLAYNFIEAEVVAPGGSTRENDWVLGGQVFIDFNYIGNVIFFGLDGKYQQTVDTDILGKWDASNWRVGLHLGYWF